MSPTSVRQASTSRRALVVGGSVGGLTAGLLLRDLGWSVEIFERSAGPLQGRGAGIVLHPTTIRYLVERVGLDIDQLTTRSRVIRFLSSDGSVAYEEDRVYRLISWNSLYTPLLGAFGDQGYHRNSEVVSCTSTSGGARIRLHDGQTESGDIVICAEGVSSSSRGQLLPGISPTYAGYVGWRGVVAESDLSPPTHQLLDAALTYQVLPNSHILFYPIPALNGDIDPGRRLINYVWYRNVPPGEPLDRLLAGRDGAARSLSVPPGHVSDEHLAELRALARRVLAAPLAEVVLATEHPFVQVVVDVSVPQMVFGRLVLIGDAAFCARPHAAAGAAKACADGWALADALGKGGPVDAALQAWERRQLEVGSRLVARAREIGSRSQVASTYEPRDQSLRFGLYGPGD